MNKDDMIKIDPQTLVDKSCFEIKYVDSEEWTVPIVLTQERLDRIVSDLSVSMIKITTLEGAVYELEMI